MANGETPRTRVVLLGASNLTRGVAAVMRQARARLDGPLDVLLACGHGRSYGMRSSVSVRALPGIVDCALWNDLAERSPLPTAALIADIGNDLVYGARPDAIGAWLRRCLERLRELDARIVMIQLPTSTIERMTPRQYWFLRNVFFSQHALTLADARARAADLARLVAGLAEEFGATLVDQDGAWYAFDPIHYPLARWNDVWGRILAGWGAARRAVGKRDSAPREWFYIRSRRPARRWIAGREYEGAQPCGRLGDGSILSLY